ncbi:DUF6415 family natural product biosynthesis protein [Streptomyces sp. NPDC048290]|uniref:DUF6415 family natural product biosynthesis protein n=1 Tax=Streptomyces sp. NPDC048290 TaxID=3155811 RepID=UPI003422ED9C
MTTAPLDIQTMRAAVQQLLSKDTPLPNEGDLETLVLQLRGHLMLTIPEIEQITARLPEDDIPRACAMAGAHEARRRLNLDPSGPFPARLAHAQRLARAVHALCDHYENLTSDRHTAALETQQLTDDMPALRTLTAHQRTGQACVWCGVGAAASGAMHRLAFVGEQAPSACERCWTVRRHALRTYLDWQRHADTCWVCAADRCATAVPLAQAHEHARAAVTDRPPYCVRCSGALLIANHQVVPRIREGYTGFYRSYAHIGLCQAEPRPFNAPRQVRGSEWTVARPSGR